MSIQVIHEIEPLRGAVRALRAGGRIIGLVPTMGALHAGHGSLVERAHRECGAVVVSVFVNPIQFDRQDDFERYPRTLDVDVPFCAERGAGIVFAPSAAEMYPQPQKTFVEVTDLDRHLCGQFRPGHFRGVATVVAKLFQIVQPDRAYFGEKDAQQLRILRRMVRDLNMPVEIVPVPTVREPDGLALSSRNQHLTLEQRGYATVLYRALCAAREAVAGGVTDAAEAKRRAAAVIDAEPRVRLEYLEITDPDDVQPVDSIAGPVLIAGAIWVGNTRLIDNVTA